MPMCCAFLLFQAYVTCNVLSSPAQGNFHGELLFVAGASRGIAAITDRQNPHSSSYFYEKKYMVCALPTLAERREKANTSVFSDQACVYICLSAVCFTNC